MRTRQATTSAARCPTCGAEPGQPCQGRRGPRVANHIERVDERRAIERWGGEVTGHGFLLHRPSSRPRRSSAHERWAAPVLDGEPP